MACIYMQCLDTKTLQRLAQLSGRMKKNWEKTQKSVEGEKAGTTPGIFNQDLGFELSLEGQVVFVPAEKEKRSVY